MLLLADLGPITHRVLTNPSSAFALVYTEGRWSLPCIRVAVDHVGLGELRGREVGVLTSEPGEIPLGMDAVFRGPGVFCVAYEG